MRTHHVQVIPAALAGQVKRRLEEEDFRFGVAPYAEFFATGSGVSVTYFGKSGKLLIQGNATDAVLLRLSDILPKDEAEPENADHAVAEPTIGSDESGKGDYFGSLVVAGCLARPSDLDYIRRLGIRDSKMAADGAILRAEGAILDRLPVEVVELDPEAYGAAHRRCGNVNVILGEAHAQVITKLLAQAPDCNRAVVDRFGSVDYVATALGERGRRLKLTMVPRAEANPAVAAASFIARARFLQSLTRLSDEVGVDLLPGASAEVERVARKIVAIGGAPLLAKVAKMHFKTTQRVLGGA